MRKNIMWFVMGIVVTLFGMGVLTAKDTAGYGWTDRDIFKVIGLLEKIAENTAR